MRRCLFVLFLCGQVIWNVPFPNTTDGQLSPSPLDDQVSPARFVFSEEDVGYILFRLSDGSTVEVRRPDAPHIPASTTKVVTAVAAEHQTPWPQIQADLQAAGQLLKPNDRTDEAVPLQQQLQGLQPRRGAQPLAQILNVVLAQLGTRDTI